jgi:O-antigen/teichoic acid export membrane protein
VSVETDAAPIPPQTDGIAAALPPRFRLNVASNYARTLLAIVIALGVTPILVHHLGKTQYGIWVLVGSTVMYLDILNLGFGNATVKYVAEHVALGDLNRVRRIIATSFLVLAVPGAIALVCGLGIAFVFPTLFKLPASLETTATVLVLLVMLDLVVSIPGDTFGGTLIALQRYDLLNATLVTVTLLQAIGWVVVLELGGGLIALGLVTLGLGLLGQLARYLFARRLIPRLTVSPRFFDRTFVRPLAGLSGWIAIIDIAGFLIARVDTVVVGLIVSVPAAGVYGVGQKLALLAGRAVSPAVETLYPFASERAAHGDKAALEGMVRVGTRLSVALALPAAIALITLAAPALDAWVGSQFTHAALVVAFLAGATAVTALTDPSLYVLRGLGEARVPALFIACEGVLNLALSVGFGLWFGLTGVAVGTFAAAAIVHLGGLLPYVCRRFGIPFSSMLWSLVRAHGPAAAAAVGVALLARSTSLDGILDVSIAGILTVLTYLAVFSATGVTRSERRVIFARLRRDTPTVAG